VNRTILCLIARILAFEVIMFWVTVWGAGG